MKNESTPPLSSDQGTRAAAEAHRVATALAEAGITLRLVGSLAVLLRCPGHAELSAQGREYKDIDFAGYARHAAQAREVFDSLGYAEDREVFVVSEGRRAIFESRSDPLHIDVFYEVLDFCHKIPLAGRLEADLVSLPLAELLLSKLQIVQIGEKDLLDSIILLLEHALADADADAINVGHVAGLCAADWGLWRTVTMNLDKVLQLAASVPQFDEPQQRRLGSQVETLLARIGAEPKPLAWRLRARVGDRVKWYRDVEEVR